MTGTWQIVSMILYLMNLCLACYAATTMILRKQDPVKTLSWLIVLILLPYIGLLFYIFLGQNYRKKKIYSRKGASDYQLRRKMSFDQQELLTKNPKLLGQELYPFRKLIFQNLKNSSTVIEHNKDRKSVV